MAHLYKNSFTYTLTFMFMLKMLMGNQIKESYITTHNRSMYYMSILALNFLAFSRVYSDFGSNLTSDYLSTFLRV